MPLIKGDEKRFGDQVALKIAAVVLSETLENLQRLYRTFLKARAHTLSFSHGNLRTRFISLRYSCYVRYKFYPHTKQQIKLQFCIF
jgi:hypothetical protein